MLMSLRLVYFATEPYIFRLQQLLTAYSNRPLHNPTLRQPRPILRALIPLLRRNRCLLTRSRSQHLLLGPPRKDSKPDLEMVDPGAGRQSETHTPEPAAFTQREDEVGHLYPHE